MSAETETSSSQLPEMDALDRAALLRFEAARLGGRARQRFRGEIWENSAGVPMGRGYANDGKPFEIETACYLKEVQREIRQRPYGLFVVMAAVQMLKTFGVIEEPVGYFIEHDPGDMVVYLSGDDSAFDQAKARLMPRIKSIPGVGRIIERVETENRHDITTAEFYLPGMVLRVWPLNESSTQRLTLRYVLISDAFLSGKTGLIGQALARTTQHNSKELKDYKVIVESQGGEAGDDFDMLWLTTDQRILYVTCPCCGMSQPFDWHRERPADFQATLPARLQSTNPEQNEAARAELSQQLRAEERRHSGMKRGDDALVKLEDGSYNEQEVKRLTHYECYHCGEPWQDTPETRRALDRSSLYVAQNPTALPENVGFSWPAWAGQRLAWGMLMLEYLNACAARDKFGNLEPLKQFYQKRAARPWSAAMSTRAAERPAAEMYDVNAEKLPGEKTRLSATDIQFNGTHMHYLAVAIGDAQPDRVLHYEWVQAPVGLPEQEQREHCKKRIRELDARFKIQPQNSMKDAAHRPDLAREWAAEDAVWAKGKDEFGRVRYQWFTYGLLIGDDAMSYPWRLPGQKTRWERFKPFHWTNVAAIKNGKRVTIPVHHRLWSNWSIKQIAERWRDGNSAPKLQIHPDFLNDTSEMGLWKQLNSERPLPWKNRPGKLKYDNENKPNHAWDCYCMITVRKDELGLLSTVSVEAEAGGG